MPPKGHAKVSTFKIHISQIPKDLSQDDLKQMFEPFGRIVECELFKKNYAFVHMEEESCGRKAIAELNGKIIDGTAIGVTASSNNEPPNVPTMKLSVKNIDSAITPIILRSLFQKFGMVLGCEISLGSGVVALEAIGDIRSAINEMNGFVLEGKALQVEPVKVNLKPSLGGPSASPLIGVKPKPMFNSNKWPRPRPSIPTFVDQGRVSRNFSREQHGNGNFGGGYGNEFYGSGPPNGGQSRDGGWYEEYEQQGPPSFEFNGGPGGYGRPPNRDGQPLGGYGGPLNRDGQPLGGYGGPLKRGGQPPMLMLLHNQNRQGGFGNGGGPDNFRPQNLDYEDHEGYNEPNGYQPDLPEPEPYYGFQYGEEPKREIHPGEAYPPPPKMARPQPPMLMRANPNFGWEKKRGERGGRNRMTTGKQAVVDAMYASGMNLPKGYIPCVQKHGGSPGPVPLMQRAPCPPTPRFPNAGAGPPDNSPNYLPVAGFRGFRVPMPRMQSAGPRPRIPYPQPLLRTPQPRGPPVSRIRTPFAGSPRPGFRGLVAGAPRPPPQPQNMHSGPSPLMNARPPRPLLPRPTHDIDFSADIDYY